MSSWSCLDRVESRLRRMPLLASKRLSSRGDSRVKSVVPKVSAGSQQALLSRKGRSAGSALRLRLLPVLMGNRGEVQPGERASSCPRLPRLMLLLKCWAMALALSRTDEGRMLVASHSFAASFSPSSSSEDSPLLKVFESESGVAEHGSSAASWSPSGFSSSVAWGLAEILGSKLSGSEGGSGSGFSVGSDSEVFSCGCSSVEGYKGRKSTQEN